MLNCARLIAMQRCCKHISAAANRCIAEQRLCRHNDYVTVEQAVVSACPI
ncbi:hypothetical protein B7P43_G07827 [Cryptotermes secundus]|uniref:Uncharacterized protein n=1 Tax=Cryptotermes secundus TaxID=105785 RepID=A0A2J7QL74_9NEOP|nr:hypothetical protein B7P43_G07827 [Cryptotermes secundus]